MTTNGLARDILDTLAQLDELEAVLSDEMHEAPVVRVEHIASEIRALARSGHVTACTGLPITQRVQSSGRAEPALAGAGDAGLRALAKLGRLYAHGGEARIAAIALWWTYSPEKPLEGDGHHLALALTLLLDAQQRMVAALSWQHWGKGPSARVLLDRGEALLERARVFYAACPSDSGSSGVFGELLAAVDAARPIAVDLRASAYVERERRAFVIEPMRVAPTDCAAPRTHIACDSDRSGRVTRCDRMRFAPTCTELRVRVASCCAPHARALRRRGGS
jgi:hypothetical protein